MKKIKLSPAQYALMEEIRRSTKVKITDRNNKTYRKLMELGLLEYHHSYDYVIFSKLGEKFEL